MCLQKKFNEVRKEYGCVPYEEIPMSLYMRKHKSKCLWIKNGFAYTDIYAFITRCNPTMFDYWNKADLDRYNRLLQGCIKYYNRH